MRRLLVGSLLVLLAGTAVPAFAGTVYVPMIASQEINGVLYETQVSITNGGAVRAEFRAYFIPVDTDGTQRGGDQGQLILLNAGGTFETTPEPGFIGMLEIDGDPELVFHARLVGSENGQELLGVQVPVITSKNIATAGTKAFLQGWRQDNQNFATFGIMNLGQVASICSVDVRRKGGVPVVQDIEIPLKPLSHMHLGEDVIGVLGNFVDVRAEVTCTEPFFTYSTTVDRDSPEIAVISHSALGTSALTRPGDAPVCPAGSVCFENAGVFHRPTRGRPVLRLVTTPPAGSYSSVKAQVKFTHGGWGAASSARHNIFWFARDGNGDLFGYVNALGPNRNIFRLGHGIGLPHLSKFRVEQKFALKVGETYVIDYVYNAQQGFINLILSDLAGNQLLQLQDSPNVRTITIRSSTQMLWDFGFPGNNPNEPATIGWQYEDLFVEFIP